MNASLSDDTGRDAIRLQALEQRVAELERRVLNQALVGRVAASTTAPTPSTSGQDARPEGGSLEQTSQLRTNRLEIAKISSAYGSISHSHSAKIGFS